MIKNENNISTPETQQIIHYHRCVSKKLLCTHFAMIRDNQLKMQKSRSQNSGNQHLIRERRLQNRDELVVILQSFCKVYCDFLSTCQIFSNLTSDLLFLVKS